MLKGTIGPGESLGPEWSEWTEPQLSDDLAFQVRAARIHPAQRAIDTWQALPWWVRLYWWLS